MSYQRVRLSFEVASDSSYNQMTTTVPAIEMTSAVATQILAQRFVLAGGYTMTLSKSTMMNGLSFGKFILYNASAAKYVTVGWTDAAAVANSSRVTIGQSLIFSGATTDITIAVQSGAGDAKVDLRVSDV